MSVMAAMTDRFAGLLERVDRGAEWVLQWDEAALDWFSRLSGLRRLEGTWVALTYLGDGYVWGLLALSLILFGGNADRLNVLVTMGVLTVVMSIVRLFKLLFSRPRPVLEGRPGREWYVDTFGFPSGHSTAAFSVAYAMASFYPHPLIVAAVYVLAAGIGLSRIYLRDHYPLDVLGGALLGSLSTHILLPLFGKILHQARW